MKKTIVFLLAIVTGSITTNAKPVACDTAKTIARNFFLHTTHNAVNFITLTYTEADSNGNPVYYVFNINSGENAGKGFVIISAEDATHPIIGYGNENNTYVLPKNSGSSVNVYWWMGKRKSEIIQIRKQNVMANATIKDEWESYANNGVPKSVQPLQRIMSTSFPSNSYFLVQTNWDQTTVNTYAGREYPDPYHYFCPDSSLTGCPATAMAQIMRYWSWPPQGVLSSCDPYSNYGTICNNYSHPYNWNNMSINTNITNPPAGDTDIARLMYDVGISIDTRYSPSSSGGCLLFNDGEYYNPTDSACVQRSYGKYFRYNPNTLYGGYLGYGNDSIGVWQDTLETDLNRNHPIEMGGGGHDWVCDGYDSLYNFHMNWGWGGYDDGWYTLTNLNTNEGNFTSGEEALWGIQPLYTPTGVGAIPLDEAMKVYPNPSNGTFTFQTKNEKLTTNCLVEVYNMLGEKVYSQYPEHTTQFSIDLSSQASGIYMYRITNENGTLINSGKLLKE